MKGSFNLSDWALKHQSFVWYLMFVALLMGVFSYMNLGREEDPSFTIKTMVIQTRWPGATQEETLKQVTDRIEKKPRRAGLAGLREKLTRPGESTVFVFLKDTTSAKATSRSGTRCARRSTTFVAPSPRVCRGRRSTTSSAMCLARCMPLPPMAYRCANCGDYVEQVRAEIRAVPGLGKRSR